MAARVRRVKGEPKYVPLVVKDLEKPQPVQFRNELVAALNVGGCNAGACHGTPSGKGGFKLSLRGFDPAAVRSQPGLGLSSMEERVRLIQGSLSITSAPGMGTTVEARVPLARSDP